MATNKYPKDVRDWAANYIGLQQGYRNTLTDDDVEHALDTMAGGMFMTSRAVRKLFRVTFTPMIEKMSKLLGGKPHGK